MEEPPDPRVLWVRQIPKKGEGLLTEGGVKKCLLVKTGFLTKSPALIEKEAWLWGMGRNKGQRRSKDHDERSFKYIQVLVSEVVSSLDALKAIGNGLIER